MVERFLLLGLLLEGVLYSALPSLYSQFHANSLWTASLQLFAVPGTLLVLSFSKGRWPSYLILIWSCWIVGASFLPLMTDKLAPSHYSGVLFVAITAITALSLIIFEVRRLILGRSKKSLS